LYLVVFVSLLQFLDNLRKTLNVLCKWFAQLHMSGADIT
jgi:hypothetical protein